MSEPENRVASAVDPHAGEHTQADEDRLARAVGEYVDALEAGRHPDRQGLVERYPEIAEELAASLDGIDFIHNVAPQLAEPAGKPARGSDQGIQPTLALGDFRIVRQIGKGGMGVVYEAVQLSLGRRMALKVLPFAAVLDPKQLQRFKNEAQAAASLKHRNIVGVHSVGCERGVHYYAMEFIEGQPLSEVIRDMRQIEGLEDGPPTEGGMLSQREALGEHVEAPEQAVTPSQRKALGEHVEAPDMPTPAPPVKASHPPDSPPHPVTPSPPQAADTQPLALLSTERSTKSPAYFRSIAELGIQVAEALDHAHQHGVVHRDVKPANVLLDTEGKAWVTDFGLARVETGATLTISGDLLGTLRYMSPEQALAKRVVVDHRTDIYSLGVTLYELLTLRPAFSGRDRQELLRQIAFEEPRPPRRLNGAIPRELETIILKATAKNPNERYDTAQELADDLRRFLEDRPIQARRPSLSTKAAKWSYRHRWAVATATSAAFAAIMLTLGLVWHGAQREVRQRERAEENLHLALEAMDEIYLQFAEDTVPELPIYQEVRYGPIPPETEEFLRKALQFYERFARANRDEPSVREETAKAYSRVGNVRSRLGMHKEAEAACSQAIEIGEDLLSEFPDVPDHRKRLARAYFCRGRARAYAANPYRQFGHGKKHLDRAIADYSRAIALDPEFGYAYNNRGFAYHLRGEADSLAKALDDLNRAIQLDPKNVNAHNNRGLVYLRRGEPDQAIPNFSEAIRLDPDYYFAHVNLGHAYKASGDVDRAVDRYSRAIQLAPEAALFYCYRGRAYSEKGDIKKTINDFNTAIRLDKGRHGSYIEGVYVREAEAHRGKGNLDEAMELISDVIRLSPKSSVARRVLGDIYKDRREFDEAISAYDEALRMAPLDVAAYYGRGCSYMELERYDRASEDLNEVLELRPESAQGYMARGLLHLRKRDLEQALQDLNEVIRIEPDRAVAYDLRGFIHADRRDFEEAVRDYTTAIGLDPNMVNAYKMRSYCHGCRGEYEESVADVLQAVKLKPDDVQLWNNLSMARWHKGDFSEAIAAAEEALGMDPEGGARYELLAYYLADCPDARLRDTDRALELAEKAAELAPDDADSWRTLGLAQYRAGEFKVAIETLQEATELAPDGDNGSWFTLSMAYWRSGDREKAWQVYDEAVRRMKSKDDRRVYVRDSLERFHREAAELLATTD